MVIGYGFADTHINDHIREGAVAGMKLFVIDPNGVDAIDTLRPAASIISEAHCKAALSERHEGTY